MTGELREAAKSRASPAIHASRTAPAAPHFRRAYVIAAIAGLFMAAIGALGTDAAGFGVRLAYWLVVMFTGSTLGTGVAFAVQSWGRLRQHRLAEGALVSLLIAAPLTAVVAGANLLAFGADMSGRTSIGIIFGVVLMVSAMMTAVTYATRPADTAPPGAPSTPAVLIATPPPAPLPSAQSPRILARLPLRLRHARLLALEAEDHYLRVHTDAGSDLVLLRLADAIIETDGLPGARCHRSWWVARDAITAVHRGGGRVTLAITPTTQVPVSRSYLAQLRTDGWLD
jgi:hypothetical protein